jgi:monothiol glutaredoxin
VDIKQQIDEAITNNKVMLYMKGTPEEPQCGFSAKVVHILEVLNAEYNSEDVLMNPQLRQAIKEYSDWPTIPQLYVKGEFLGGCDIITELYLNGELDAILKG